MLAMLLATDASSAASDAAGAAIAGGFSLVYCACWAIGILFFIATLVFWIMMLVDCIKRDEADFPNSSGNSKTIWLVVLIASWFVGSFYWLAAIVYYFMVKRGSSKTPSAPTPPPPPPAAS